MQGVEAAFYLQDCPEERSESGTYSHYQRHIPKQGGNIKCTKIAGHCTKCNFSLKAIDAKEKIGNSKGIFQMEEDKRLDN